MLHTGASTARPRQVGGEEKQLLLTHARHLSLHNINATGREFVSTREERSDNEINRKQAEAEYKRKRPRTVPSLTPDAI
jgi:hypothetical protein